MVWLFILRIFGKKTNRRSIGLHEYLITYDDVLVRIQIIYLV